MHRKVERSGLYCTLNFVAFEINNRIEKRSRRKKKITVTCVYIIYICTELERRVITYKRYGG